MSANGRLTAAELVAVQGTIHLAPKTAAAFLAMERAAAAAGKRLDIPADGGYRSFERQAWMRAHPALYPGKKLATAGTSNHGLGICVDIIGDVQWAIDNAARFGFTRPIKGDDNHFQHDGKSVPAPSKPDEDDDMKLYFASTRPDAAHDVDQTWVMIPGRGWVHVKSPADLGLLQRAANYEQNRALPTTDKNWEAGLLPGELEYLNSNYFSLPAAVLSSTQVDALTKSVAAKLPTVQQIVDAIAKWFARP